jgi:hypothetical protein
MATAAHLDALPDRLVAGDGFGGLANGVGERLKVVTAGSDFFGRQPDELPSHRSREPLGVFRTEVVAVRLDVRGKRTQDRGGVTVDVREREDCRLFARGAGAGAYGAHDGRPYPPHGPAASFSTHVSP